MGIIAYHAIFTTYGTWLPNDPRGSFSHRTHMRELQKLGDIKYGRQDPQPSRDHLRRFWKASRETLPRAPYYVDDRTRPIIGGAFDRVAAHMKLAFRACAIMNDHVHVLVEKPSQRIEHVVAQLKGWATRSLGLNKTPWSRGCWKVFINDHEVLESTRLYIENNPIKARMKPQKWSFVTP